jgi:hypothetical protein
LDQLSQELLNEAQNSVTQSDGLQSSLDQSEGLAKTSLDLLKLSLDSSAKAIASAEADRDKAKAEAEVIRAELQRWQIAAWSAGAFALASVIGLVLALIF